VAVPTGVATFTAAVALTVAGVLTVAAISMVACVGGRDRAVVGLRIPIPLLAVCVRCVSAAVLRLPTLAILRLRRTTRVRPTGAGATGILVLLPELSCLLSEHSRVSRGVGEGVAAST